MPESRIRRKAAYTPPTKTSGEPKASPPWYVPVMLTLMVIGLIWIVVFYITQGAYPLPPFTVPVIDQEWNPGSWNLVIGFGFILVGFVMTTRWR